MPVTTKFKTPSLKQRSSDMPMIYVRTRPDRRAYFEGRVIPQDKFIPVTDTPYIRRLIDHWGDLEVEGGRSPAPGEAKRHAPPAVGKEEARPPSVKPAAPTQAAPNIPAPGTGAPKPNN